MKNHRFLWLRNRTTNNRKCEKARNIKEKRTIEMFNTDLKQLVELHSSQNVNFSYARDNLRNSDLRSSPCLQGFVELSDVLKSGGIYSVRNAFATRLQQKYLKNIGHFSVIGTGECPFCYADFVSAVTLSSFSKVLLIASTRTCISK